MVILISFKFYLTCFITKWHFHYKNENDQYIFLFSLQNLNPKNATRNSKYR